MPTLMLLRVAGNGAQLEKATAADPRNTQSIIATAKAHGLITHQFWATDTELLVVDTWPDEQSFHDFFAEAGERIAAVMAAASVTTEPEVTFYRKLDVGDEV
ncbi:hypothetical protein [Amycolatopsis sp. NPDC051903]|uniref:hypothetical protein n=1 Tax=Amycolatopsis sp. NPDC051903 TaxID=3363936 RepID=UPI0037AE881D